MGNDLNHVETHKYASQPDKLCCAQTVSKSSTQESSAMLPASTNIVSSPNISSGILQTQYYTDEDDTLNPTWLTQPRGFVDAAFARTQQLEGFLSDLPKAPAVTWTREQHAWNIGVDVVTLRISVPQGISSIFVVTSSNAMPRRFLDDLRSDCREIVSAAAVQRNTRTAHALHVVFLQLIEASISYVLAWKPELKFKPAHNIVSEPESMIGWNAILSDSYGIDLSSVDDAAQHILQKPIAEICSGLPDWLRLLHCEPVFRSDLVAKFLRRQDEIREMLRSLPYHTLRAAVPPFAVQRGSSGDDKWMLADYLAQPSVTFHGAPRHVIGSIVRHGFVKPGSSIGQSKHTAHTSGTILQSRFGQSHGAGTYSSPSALYASYYASDSYRQSYSEIAGLRLIVCATLMGLPRKVTVDEARGRTNVYRPKSAKGPRAHSHISENGLEYIVFDSAQIIPCYVLHLDYGAETARREFARLPVNAAQWSATLASMAEKRRKQQQQKAEEELYPGLRKEKKEAQKAAASKWFPYGYGPAKGTRFVIEEVGEVDDDEEVYGDYQALRGEYEREVQEREERLAPGGSWFDEYQTVRMTKK